MKVLLPLSLESTSWLFSVSFIINMSLQFEKLIIFMLFNFYDGFCNPSTGILCRSVPYSCNETWLCWALMLVLVRNLFCCCFIYTAVLQFCTVLKLHSFGLKSSFWNHKCKNHARFICALHFFLISIANLKLISWE